MVIPRISNAIMEIFCFVLCTLLLLFPRFDRRKADRPTQWFFAMVMSCAMLNLGGMTDWLLSGVPGPGANLVLWTGSCLFYVASAAMIITYAGYLLSYIERQGVPVSPWLLRIGVVLAGITALAALTSPITGWVYYVSAGDNVYHRGIRFAATQLPSYLVYVLAAYTLIRYRRSLTVRAKLFFWTFSMAPLVAQAIQGFIYGIALLPVTLSLTLVLAFIFLHSEAQIELEQKEYDLQTTELTHLEQLQKHQAMLTEQIIVALSSAVEAKDRYTNGHSQRVALYSKEIVRRMGMDEERQQWVYYAGLLHDVGKIRVSDAIINKTDSLTSGEYEQMRLHTLSGYYILKEISAISDFAVGARWHHERFDGAGYPNGLSGENIPLIARIICVADAYDAMTSSRSYRNIMPQAQARREIENGMGTQFDPNIARVMLDMIDEDKEFRMCQSDVRPTRTILAIDDDPMVLRLLEFTLKKEPLYRLITAASGPDGLAMLDEQPVDLVLLDVEMPGMDGFEVLARIREKYQTLPVIFMTGDKELEMIQRAEAMGVSDYRTKPLLPNIMFESIQNVLASAYRQQTVFGTESPFADDTPAQEVI